MSRFSSVFSTPFGNMINLPDSENKLFKASVYNSFALILLIGIGASVISVYFLFEIFIKPLMWSLLVGTCIFPFKRYLKNSLHTWINDNTNENSQPLLLAIILLPINVFFAFGEKLIVVIMRRFKLFLFYIIGIPLVYTIYNAGVISNILSSMSFLYLSASNVIALFGSKLVSIMIITMIIALFVLCVFLENVGIRVLTVLASIIWILSIIYISTFAGNLALFVFTSLIVLFSIGGLTEALDLDLNNVSLSQFLPIWEYITKPYRYASKIDDHNHLSEAEDETVSESELMESQDTILDSSRKTNADYSAIADADQSDVHDESQQDIFTKGDELDTPIPVREKQSNRVTFMINAFESTVDWCSKLFTPSRVSVQRGYESFSQNSLRRSNPFKSMKLYNKTLVNRVFMCLLWSHIIIYSWSHMWVVLIMLIAILLVAVKKVLVKLEVADLLRWIVNSLLEKLHQLLGDRIHLFYPIFIRGSIKVIIQLDEKIRKLLITCLDSLVSMFVIASLLFVTIFLAIFLAFQVHNESLHLVALSSNVLNSTMSSEIFSWLPERKDITSVFDSVANNAYLFGREWISKKIDQLFDINAYNKARLEEQALELWEKLYHRIILKNNSANISLSFQQQLLSKSQTNRQYSFVYLQKHVYGIWDILVSGDVLDFTKMIDFMKENLGLFSAVLESLWSVIRSNVNIALSIVTGLMSAVLGGGTFVLNFIVSLIIFLSALYYLLAFSKDRYLPIACIGSLTTNAEDNPIFQSIYTSIENGISSVFAVTFKMACFYGFYTSLTHSLCGVNFVVIPSIMAAIFAAVPIVGTYWAAIPAITELVFINQDFVGASVLLLLHLIPMYSVDTAIYSEIKETGHPYLTGLAIAGGVYWLGLQGAVIGPLLLCSLVIVLNLIKSVMTQDENQLSVPAFNDRRPSTGILKKSKSCDKSRYI